MEQYIVKETDFEGIGTRKVGKVRDIYEQADKFIFVTTDRHSSFDRVIAHIPWKGAVLNLLSAFWFEQTKDIIPNHIIEVPDPNVTVGKKCTPLSVEIVVRGYITGVTDTSLWTLYNNGQRDFGNFVLPDGLTKNQKLEKPVFTPTTKSDLHDRPITPVEIVSEGLLTEEVVDKAEATALKLFERGAEIANKAGLILVDTKYEFGFDENGTLTIIDEIHTPDSSRYWKRGTYKERIAKGEEPQNFDKEFLRLWFKDNCDPYKDAVLPEAPAEMVLELSRRYIDIYESLTGKKFVVEDTPPIERMEKNLSKFKL